MPQSVYQNSFRRQIELFKDLVLIYYSKAHFFSVVIVFPFNELYPSIHSTNTNSTCYFEANKTVIAPFCTPWILKFPVVVVATGVLQPSPVFMLRTVWPPSWNLTFSGLLISVANYDCSVINFIATAILFSDYTLFVKLPGGLASIDSDRHRVILGIVLNRTDISIRVIIFACNSTPSLQLSNDLVWVKSTVVLLVA